MCCLQVSPPRSSLSGVLSPTKHHPQVSTPQVRRTEAKLSTLPGWEVAMRIHHVCSASTTVSTFRICPGCTGSQHLPAHSHCLGKRQGTEKLPLLSHMRRAGNIWLCSDGSLERAGAASKSVNPGRTACSLCSRLPTSGEGRGCEGEAIDLRDYIARQ